MRVVFLLRETGLAAEGFWKSPPATLIKNNGLLYICDRSEVYRYDIGLIFFKKISNSVIEFRVSRVILVEITNVEEGLPTRSCATATIKIFLILVRSGFTDI